MADFRYKSIHPIAREELIKQLASNDPRAVANALYAATKYEEDWRWVQDLCIRNLNSPDVPVRWAAATCLGDLAFLRRPLDLDVVLPALLLA